MIICVRSPNFTISLLVYTLKTTMLNHTLCISDILIRISNLEFSKCAIVLSIVIDFIYPTNLSTIIASINNIHTQYFQLIMKHEP